MWVLPQWACPYVYRYKILMRYKLQACVLHLHHVAHWSTEGICQIKNPPQLLSTSLLQISFANEPFTSQPDNHLAIYYYWRWHLHRVLHRLRCNPLPSLPIRVWSRWISTVWLTLTLSCTCCQAPARSLFIFRTWFCASMGKKKTSSSHMLHILSRQ